MSFALHTFWSIWENALGLQILCSFHGKSNDSIEFTYTSIPQLEGHKNKFRSMVKLLNIRAHQF